MIGSYRNAVYLLTHLRMSVLGNYFYIFGNKYKKLFFLFYFYSLKLPSNESASCFSAEAFFNTRRTAQDISFSSAINLSKYTISYTYVILANYVEWWSFLGHFISCPIFYFALSSYRAFKRHRYNPIVFLCILPPLSALWEKISHNRINFKAVWSLDNLISAALLSSWKIVWA